MSLGTIYTKIAAGEATRTRVLLPECLIKYFELDIKMSDPDEYFPSKFTLNQVPCFRFPDNTLLSESIPITLYMLQQVENHGGLLGDNSQKAWAVNMQWMEFMNNDFMRPAGTIFTMLTGRKPYIKDVYDFVFSHFKNVAMPAIESRLAQNEFLTGSQLSIADLYAVCMFLRPLAFFVDKSWREQLPHTMAWWKKVSSHPIFDNFFADLELVDKYTPPE